MTKKYEFVEGDTIKTLGGKTLKRIRALIAIAGIVAPGELGGYIEAEKNLKHEGDAWVSDDARVYGNAHVSDDAWVSGNARVFGNAWVFGDAWVSGNAQVSGDARVSGNARVHGNAQVSGNARVFGDAWVSGNAWVCDRGLIFWASIVGSENGTLTVYNGKNNTLLVTRGCFSGTVDEFLDASKGKHNERMQREYALLVEVAKSRIEYAREQKAETTLRNE